MISFRHISMTLIFILSTLNILSAEENKLNSCFKAVKKDYYQNAQRSDVPRTFEAAYVLNSNESLRGFQNEELGFIFNDEKLIYKGTGSVHSGYFIDLVVVNPQDCKVLHIVNVYSE